MPGTFDIALYYAHETAGIWSLSTLAEHRGVIHFDDLPPEAFYNALGAIRFYHDRYHCFLETGEAGEVVSYVYFLMETSIRLLGDRAPEDLQWLAPPREIPGFDTVLSALHQEDGSRIVLQSAGDDILISFLDANGNAPEIRLSPYFRNYRVRAEQWQRSAVQALDEYFSVARERLDEGRSESLEKLYRHWLLLRGSIGM